MKKFFLLFAVAGMLVACGGNEEKKSGEDAAKKTEQPANDPKGAPEAPAQNDENVTVEDEGEAEYGYEYGLDDEFANKALDAAYAAGELGNHDEDYAYLEGDDFDDKYDSGLEYELDDDYSDLYDEESDLY